MPRPSRSSVGFALSPTKRLSMILPAADSPRSRRHSMVDGSKNNENVFLDVPENNDEIEKKQRQLNRLQQQIHSKTFSPTSAQADRRKSISSVSGLTSQQLTEHYAKCIQLSTENKISVKNAFKLQLIDYMSEMLQRKDSEMNNFQVASCTLDASTKIYAYRVDSVHTDTLKMAGGLGRTQDKEGKEFQDEEGPGEGAGEKKKRKTKKKMVIEANIKNISLNKFDVDFEIDPLFKKICTQFDEGNSGSGQFLNSLPMMNDSCTLMLDSETVLLSSGNEAESSEKPVVYIPQPEDTSKRMICPTFAPFEFTTWKLGDEDSFCDMSKLMSSDEEDDAPKSDDQHRFDVNAVPQPIDNSMDCGADDGFDMECTGAEDHDTVVTVGQEGYQQAPPPLMEAVHLKDHLAAQPSEYSYFDSRMMSAWAGPAHWKLKPLSKVTSLGGNKQDDKRKKKEFIHIDFKEEDPEIARLFVVTKKATELTQYTLKTWTKEKTTMPVDLHFEGRNFTRLYGCPALVIQKQRKAATVDESVDEYNYDNQNDRENYCADVDDTASGYGDNSAPGYDVTDLFSETAIGSQPTNGEDPGDRMPDFLDNLVAAPNKVAKINIAYARTAKKMDMKKLKSSMWDVLTDSSTDKENNKQSQNCPEVPETTKIDPNYSIDFSVLYKILPHRLSSKMSENLSVPLAFIGLLHLANEHNLKLIDMGNLSDFSIKQG